MCVHVGEPASACVRFYRYMYVEALCVAHQAVSDIPYIVCCVLWVCLNVNVLDGYVCGICLLCFFVYDLMLRCYYETRLFGRLFDIPIEWPTEWHIKMGWSE